ncbi:DUF6531 domain-containing protein [Bdellovibrio sp. HCB337]|uniref:DUF6531 domain-containing protein n=1 Tax=Bdellovibrio sp. HCB337 TaxID=3394358 RepID=UPI0039A72156
MKDASYVKTWIDIEIKKDRRVFQLRRTYNSRSLHQGLFGFGWCSDFEKRLDLSRSDQITLKDCRLNAPIKFLKKSPTQYESADKEIIEYKDKIYTRTTAKKTLQKYNNLGLLINLTDTTQDRLDITYDLGGFPKKITINNHTELKVKPDLLRQRIQSLSTDKVPGATYRYEGKDLVHVKNSWNNQFNYQYDGTHNLVKVLYPDKTSEVLAYDPEKDWVVSINNRNKCLETFKFIQKTNSQNYSATAEKRCNGKVITKTTYEFRHKARADGTKYLDQVQVTHGNKIQRVSYQNHTGPLNESQ